MASYTAKYQQIGNPKIKATLRVPQGFSPPPYIGLRIDFTTDIRNFELVSEQADEDEG